MALPSGLFLHSGQPAEKDNSSSEEDPEQLGFRFSLVEPFIQAVKQAITWEEEEVPKKDKSYFPFLQKWQAYFPIHGRDQGRHKAEVAENRKKVFPQPYAEVISSTGDRGDIT